jgi:NADH dehydrogenase
VLKRQRNVTVLLAEVRDFDPEEKWLLLDRGDLHYDDLVVASGVGHHYFGHPEWEELAPGLKTIEDATAIRGRILRAFEDAERSDEGDARRALLTFVIVGAGPTGVELAGAIGELARHTMRRDFRRIDPSAAKILLVEGASRVLPAYREDLAASAQRSLERLGVEVLVETMVEEIGPSRVGLTSKSGSRTIEAATVLWAAGVEGSPLGRRLAARTGVGVDRAGRVEVEPDCSLRGHSEIFVIGDLAALDGPHGKPLPGVAPVAMQQGAYVGRLLRERSAGRGSPPFRYSDRGSLAVIGRAAAVAELGRLRFSGYPAWLLWLFVHIMYLVGFANRLLVFIQWAYGYLTRGRGARLITGRAAQLDGEVR